MIIMGETLFSPIFMNIMNAKAFIIVYLNALADTQIGDLLPAYRAIISYLTNSIKNGIITLSCVLTIRRNWR